MHTITGYLLMTVKKKLLIIANVPFENTLDTGSDLCGAQLSDSLDVYMRLKGGENSIKVGYHFTRSIN